MNLKFRDLVDKKLKSAKSRLIRHLLKLDTTKLKNKLIN